MQNIAILDSGHNVQSNEFLIKSLVRNGFNVVYNNCDYKELVSLSNTTHIDVFIFGDSYIPDDTIYSFTYLMSNLKSEIWIISTGNSDVGNLQKFLNKRTNAIIEKNNIKEMLIAIDNCCSGRKYFSPIFHTSIYSMVRSNREDSLNFDVLNQESLNAISLSESAYNVLVCLAEGYKYVQIAQKLDISLDSVRYYVKEIYRKLGVKNKGAAVGMFLRKEIEINTRLRERKNILKVNTKERFVENY